MSDRMTGSAASAGDIAVAAGFIRAGGVVVYPTETFYGLGVDPFRSSALQALIDIKGRGDGRPIALIAGSLEEVMEAFGGLSPLALRLSREFWPGPLTLVLPAPPAWPHALRSSGGGAGVRVPGLESARALATAGGGLLTATSANLSGHPPASTPAEVRAGLPQARLDMVLDGGKTPGGLPSTVLDLSADSPRLVRAGSIGLEALELVIGGPIAPLF